MGFCISSMSTRKSRRDGGEKDYYKIEITRNLKKKLDKYFQTIHKG